MDVTAALLDSWDRQCRIVTALAGRVNESNKLAKPSPDGMPLFEQLAHIHLVRKYWLSQLDPDGSERLGKSYTKGWDGPIEDLDAIKQMLNESATAVRTAVEHALGDSKEKAGFYDNPVLFLQHMIWHEGWHVGLIVLGLRLAGDEPSEEWEETRVWGEWRTEVW